MSKRVLLAMSGGVDSSVAASILKREGWDVVGATIKTWSSDECKDERSKGCCSIRDIGDARSVAGKLGIPYYVLDLSADFKEKVIDYYIESYLDAKTPNPCAACNTHIKFGIFLEKAKELKADFVATGHYARRIYTDGRWTIAEALDPSKDQSYVLFGLNQEQLAKTLFPVGDYPKSEIREMARELGLRVHDKPDSQEICFVRSHYGEVIEKARPDAVPGKGRIVTSEREVLGEHEGYYLYTVGQRKGLGLSDAEPYYVISVSSARNEVVVGREEDLYQTSMKIEKMNWRQTPVKGPYEIKIRSYANRSSGRLVEYTPGEAVFRFDKGERAITPGQAAVLYNGTAVVGGGWIKETF